MVKVHERDREGCPSLPLPPEGCGDREGRPCWPDTPSAGAPPPAPPTPPPPVLAAVIGMINLPAQLASSNQSLGFGSDAI
jgi:hypothetical protein